MFLAQATANASSVYLVSGDLAVALTDTVTIANFKGVGVPLIQLSPEELSDLTTRLAPPR